MTRTTHSPATETFQVTAEQAEVYEAAFVPAIFAQWAGPLLDAAGVRRGQSVLDVATGTGVLARAAAARVGPHGSVEGLDLNANMLAVARRLRPDLSWHQGDAADLPFPDAAFDAVVCQSGLMFFPDADRAVREMARVTRPGGVVGLQVYAALDEQPAYGPWVRMVAEHTGPDAVSLLGTYWAQGDRRTLARRLEQAGLQEVDVRDRLGTAHFDSVEQLVETEIGATPLAARIDDAARAAVLAGSHDVLDRFVTSRGLEAPILGRFAVGRRR